MRGKYDSHECTACGDENESQEHVIKCNVLLQMNTDYDMEVTNYEETSWAEQSHTQDFL